MQKLLDLNMAISIKSHRLRPNRNACIPRSKKKSIISICVVNHGFGSVRLVKLTKLQQVRIFAIQIERRLVLFVLSIYRLHLFSKAFCLLMCVCIFGQCACFSLANRDSIGRLDSPFCIAIECSMAVETEQKKKKKHIRFEYCQ